MPVIGGFSGQVRQATVRNEMEVTEPVQGQGMVSDRLRPFPCEKGGKCLQRSRWNRSV